MSTYNKPNLRLVVNNKERIDMSELRTPIGKFCLKLTRTPKPVNPDGKLRGTLGSFYSSFLKSDANCASLMPTLEGQAFGVVRGSLASTCAEIYNSFVALIPHGKSADKQAEETLLRSGWTQEQIQEVRVLEQQMRLL